MAIQFNTASVIRNNGEGLLHLFYPRLCEGCSKPLLQPEEVLCIGCEMQIARTSYHHLAGNETIQRMSGRFPCVRASSFAYFSDDSLMQHLVLGLKYRSKKLTGRYLGKLFGDELKQAGWMTDVIVPIPLHPKKEAARGYNQSRMIADGLSLTLDVPVLPDVLIRKKATETQTDKTRAERVMNVKDAFNIVDAQKLQGKHLLLVDDVITTGATLESGALSILSTCRDVRISIATIAIAVN